MEIKNYKIDQEIGTGATATVYLAEHTALNRKIALKVMHSKLADNENLEENFLSEGRIIASLDHINIVKIYDIGITEESIYYMSMEYFSAGTLKQRIRQQRLSLEEIVTIMEDIVSGLSFAHENNIIHRDIKPANILFHKNGHVAISDFGTAKLKNTTSDLTRQGYVQGTLQYMSPEQATTTQLDNRSDLYSLGLVFYEMLTGEKACDADTTVQAIYQHTIAPTPELPKEFTFLQPLLNKVLAKSPSERFATANEFLAELKSILSSKEQNVDTLTVTATNSSKLSTIIKGSVAGNRFIKWGLLSSLVLLIAVALLVGLPSSTKEDVITTKPLEQNRSLKMEKLQTVQEKKKEPSLTIKLNELQTHKKSNLHNPIAPTKSFAVETVVSEPTTPTSTSDGPELTNTKDDQSAPSTTPDLTKVKPTIDPVQKEKEITEVKPTLDSAKKEKKITKVKVSNNKLKNNTKKKQELDQMIKDLYQSDYQRRLQIKRAKQREAARARLQRKQQKLQADKKKRQQIERNRNRNSWEDDDDLEDSILEW